MTTSLIYRSAKTRAVYYVKAYLRMNEGLWEQGHLSVSRRGLVIIATAIHLGASHGWWRRAVARHMLSGIRFHVQECSTFFEIQMNLSKAPPRKALSDRPLSARWDRKEVNQHPAPHTYMSE
jgi:hypothetical protein